MNAKMRVVLEGLPERIQQTADILEQAFPGLINWRLAEPGRDQTIRLEGVAKAHDDVSYPPTRISPSENSGRTWKLSSLAARENQQGKRFCALLSRSLQS